MNYARQHNVTKVIAGKPLRPPWQEIIRGSVVDQLVRQSGTIDVYIISGGPSSTEAPEEIPWRPHAPLRRYLWGAFLVAAATGLSAFFHLRISPTNLVMIYLLTVVIAALYLGRGPAVLVSILGVLVFDFFFVPPPLTLAVSDTEYILTFAGLLVVGIVISQLTARVRDQAEAAERREADTSALYALSRDLAAAGGMDSILKAIIVHFGNTFGRQVAVYLPVSGDLDHLQLTDHSEGFTPDENEEAVATWAFQHGQMAGRGTDTLSAAEARYLPLKTAQGAIGVIGIQPRDTENGPGLIHLSPDQHRLSEAFASQAALAIERAQLAEQARQAHISQETEKLQTALLNSISHDLRTPLVSITGALSSLRDDQNDLTEKTRRSLLDMAGEEADRLNRLVGNLLNMTRLEAGAMQLTMEPADIQDVIGSALEQVSDRFGDRKIVVDTSSDLPLVPMDFVLIVQVLVNLLDNALKYSPPDSPIEVRAQCAGAFLEIEVVDRGVGIPQEDLKHVFDKFYRVQRPEQISGTGLGLSICKGIVEAHGGFIEAENQMGGGTVITAALPLVAGNSQSRTPTSD
jgi:two-component system sensor histidine kinase KdpD